MILSLIVCCFIIKWINNSLSQLEYKQRVLCYDMQILNSQIKRDEIRLLQNY